MKKTLLSLTFIFTINITNANTEQNYLISQQMNNSTFKLSKPKTNTIIQDKTNVSPVEPTAVKCMPMGNTPGLCTCTDGIIIYCELR